MLIKTSRHLTEEKKDLIEAIVKERVIIVPKGVFKIFIYDEKGEFIVYGERVEDEEDEGDEGVFDEIARFNDIEDCWVYTKTIAEELDLSFKDIDFVKVLFTQL
ncbi:hypothetical protein V7659_00385 [Neobacillus drentensis]|uniref:hypothetical protein n=1 Tax=Neobacillus drentensis TaxID=220684 RepID=UPI002FFEA659